MQKLILKRVADTEHGCFGVLLHQGAPFAVTLEPPWRDNQPNVSCIPSGVYQCRRVDYSGSKYQTKKWGRPFEITGVQGRSRVLLHWGNKREHTEGCVLVAESYGYLAGVPAVLTSKNSPGKGFHEFMGLVEDKPSFSLDIQWRCDGEAG